MSHQHPQPRPTPPKPSLHKPASHKPAQTPPPKRKHPPPSPSAHRPNKENASHNIHPRPSTLKSLLTTLTLHADTPQTRRDLLRDRDKILSGAIRAATQANTPLLHRQAAQLLARLSVDPAPAPLLCTPPFLPALEAALRSTAALPASERGLLTDAHRDAARAVRNLVAFSVENALMIARGSDVVRLLVAILAEQRRRPAQSAVECAAALANFARYGLHFQAYVRKHGGLPVLADAAKQREDASCKFHACRALAEFSLECKWLMLLVADGCIPIMLAIIEHEKDEEVLSEATRFLGNLATSKTGREAVNAVGGVDVLVRRVLTTVQSSRTSPKTSILTIDLLRTTSNLCVASKPAAQALINRGGIIAFIEAYGDVPEVNSPSSKPKPSDQIRTEAFRGLLIVAQGGHAFRASVLREIGIKIRQDVSQGRSTAHLYDLGRRIKVEASTERNDDFPTTIAGLGEQSKKYLFAAGPLATDTQLSPNTVPDLTSPTAAGFRQSGRLLSVQRPVPHRERLERDRRERPPRMPLPTDAPQSPRRPRAESAGANPHRSPERVEAGGRQRATSADGHGGGRAVARRGADELAKLDDIPRCKVIESGKGRNQSGDGNWVMAVWSAVCNAVTRPPNAAAPQVQAPSQGSTKDTFGSELSGDGELGEDVYEIGVPLGRGGFATVFLAKSLRTGELVAVKRFHPRNTSTPDALQKAELAARRAIKEQRIWDGLSHKNIVSYRGCFLGEDGELNLVAEYIPGWSLADHLSQISKFPEHMVACITLQIVDGLNYLHKCGVTHRDVKPANILVNPDGIIKITDFGVSSATHVPTMTGNTIVGTPWYIAPEMIEGRPYGKSVDIWSLGCTVIELATGRRPYHNMNAQVALFHMTRDRMPPIPKKLSPLLRDFLKTCWVWNPAERPTPAHLRRHPFLSAVVRPEVTNLKNMARKT